MKLVGGIRALLLIGHALSGLANTASAHSLGAVDSREPPPPLKLQMLEIKAAQEYLSGGAPRTRAIYDDFKIWPAESTLRVCFFDGDDKLTDLDAERARFDRAIIDWADGQHAMDLAAMMRLVIEHVRDEHPARPRHVALGATGIVGLIGGEPRRIDVHVLARAGSNT